MEGSEHSQTMEITEKQRKHYIFWTALVTKWNNITALDGRVFKMQAV